MKSNKCILRKFATMLALIVSGAFLLEACAKEPSLLEGAGRITMTTKAAKVLFSLKGAEDITIDWGDGKKSDVKDAINELDKTFLFAHEYSGADAHNIVITGSNITMLYCRDISLTALDVSRNTALLKLNCNFNQITSLDVSNNTAFIFLFCNDNQLESLDVTNNTALESLACYGNLFEAVELNAIFGTLHSNPGTAGCDPTIATAKGDGLSLINQQAANLKRTPRRAFEEPRGGGRVLKFCFPKRFFKYV
jgi:hypothetical protein